MLLSVHNLQLGSSGPLYILINALSIETSLTGETINFSALELPTDFVGE